MTTSASNVVTCTSSLSTRSRCACCGGWTTSSIAPTSLGGCNVAYALRLTDASEADVNGAPGINLDYRFFTKRKMTLMLAQYRKFLAALAGVLAQIVAANVVSGTALHYTQVASALVAALLVVGIPNAEPA